MGCASSVPKKKSQADSPPELMRNLSHGGFSMSHMVEIPVVKQASLDRSSERVDDVEVASPRPKGSKPTSGSRSASKSGGKASCNGASASSSSAVGVDTPKMMRNLSRSHLSGEDAHSFPMRHSETEPG